MRLFAARKQWRNYSLPLPGHAAGHIGAFVLTDNGGLYWLAMRHGRQLTTGSCEGFTTGASGYVRQPRLLPHAWELHQLWQNGVVEIRLCHEGDYDPVDVDLALLPYPQAAFHRREALENWQAKRLHQFRQNVYLIARGFSVI